MFPQNKYNQLNYIDFDNSAQKNGNKNMENNSIQANCVFRQSIRTKLYNLQYGIRTQKKKKHDDGVFSGSDFFVVS
jgi:hypothetical protein